MDEAAFARVSDHLQSVDLPLHVVLFDPEDPITHVYFPESAVISLVLPQLDGSEPELATIGREGAAGCITSVGSKSAYSRWIIQVPGRALKCPAPVFEAAFEQEPSFRQLIVCYMEALLTQTMQSVACNAIHPVEARCARWILMMRDRNDGAELPLTQEFLAQILAVHRSSVALALGALQQAGFIKARRGCIEVVDEAGLESAACECYRLVRDRFEDLIPGSFA